MVKINELRSLIINAIIIVVGSLILECESIYLLFIGEIDLAIFFTFQIGIGCLLSLLYIEYYEYNI